MNATIEHGDGVAAEPRLPRVDQRLAHDVCAAFLCAPSTPTHPTVAAAYCELTRQSDDAFRLLAGRPAAVRVVFTRCPAPYSSDVELITAVRATRLLEVPTAAADRDRVHPLLGCELGGPYDRFRAVHDIVGHVIPRFGFDRDGEFSAWRVQERMYHGLARWALATELHAEHSVRWTTGCLNDHKATLLDRRLLRRARRGAREANTP
jgi:hypothetical protein